MHVPQDGALQLDVTNMPGSCAAAVPSSPGTFEPVTSAATQSAVDTWNKLCFKGGYLEVGLQLPPAVFQGHVSLDVRLVGNLRRYNKHHVGDDSIRVFPPMCGPRGEGGGGESGQDAMRMWPCGEDAG